jgi:hypothetical protein
MSLAAATNDPAPFWLWFAIPIAFAIVFPLIWCFVCFLISRIGSWHKLSKVFAAGTRQPAGQAHRGVVGQLGLASYKFTLIVTFAEDGFFLQVAPFFRPGHPPLFIPWNAVSERNATRLLRWDMVTLRLGSPKVATIALALPEKLFDRPA